MNQEVVNDKKTSEIRIEFIHKQVKKLSLFSIFSFLKTEFPVQHIPFHYGLRVTNIGKSVFYGCEIHNFKMDFKGAGISSISDTTQHIKLLNPNESVDIYFDKYKPIHDGPFWVDCTLSSSDGSDIQAYQFGSTSFEDAKHPRLNHWGQSMFIQRRLELLQAQTNILIFILTIITFLEATLGINNIFKFITEILSSILIALGNLLII